MHPSTRIGLPGEYATLDRTMENSNAEQSWPPATEVRNSRTRDIDTVPTLELLTLLNAEDAAVAGAVRATLPVLAAGTFVEVRGIQQSGTLTAERVRVEDQNGDGDGGGHDGDGGH